MVAKIILLFGLNADNNHTDQGITRIKINRFKILKYFISDLVEKASSIQHNYHLTTKIPIKLFELKRKILFQF